MIYSLLMDLLHQKRLLLISYKLSKIILPNLIMVQLLFTAKLD